MKLVSAIIREHQLDKVHEELINAGITRITVVRVSGHGNQVREQVFRGQVVVPGLIPKIKIEIAVNEEFVETTIDVITKAAKTGEVGDGKIFVVSLEECVRIRTGERGGQAI